MLTNICGDRLIVISDLHLGNPACFSKRKIVEFLAYAADNDYNLCINGDGFDIAQTSFVRLAQEVPEVFKQFRRFEKKNLKVYYGLQIWRSVNDANLPFPARHPTSGLRQQRPPVRADAV